MKYKKIFIVGHNGMVGSAVLRNLKKDGYKNLIVRPRQELDLLQQKDVEIFFKRFSPEIVIIAAAKVGGIYSNNKYRADFLYQNLMIETNIINSSYKNNVEKLIFLGSSCIYPKLTEQPIKEESILTGLLEPTNEPYSIAKIAGIKLCENYYRQYGCNFFSLMPTNLYGINDYFHKENSHVIPALLRRMYEAKLNDEEEFIVWGTGNATREFLHVDDLAESINFAIKNLDAEDIYSLNISQLNIGTGKEISIKELAETIKEVVEYKGRIVFDHTKPDGMPRRVLDVSRINKFGWKYKTDLQKGLYLTYKWYKNNINNLRK